MATLSLKPVKTNSYNNLTSILPKATIKEQMKPKMNEN